MIMENHLRSSANLHLPEGRNWYEAWERVVCGAFPSAEGGTGVIFERGLLGPTVFHRLESPVLWKPRRTANSRHLTSPNREESELKRLAAQHGLKVSARSSEGGRMDVGGLQRRRPLVYFRKLDGALRSVIWALWLGRTFPRWNRLGWLSRSRSAEGCAKVLGYGGASRVPELISLRRALQIRLIQLRLGIYITSFQTYESSQ